MLFFTLYLCTNRYVGDFFPQLFTTLRSHWCTLCTLLHYPSHHSWIWSVLVQSTKWESILRTVPLSSFTVVIFFFSFFGTFITINYSNEYDIVLCNFALPSCNISLSKTEVIQTIVLWYPGFHTEGRGHWDFPPEIWKLWCHKCLKAIIGYALYSIITKYNITL